MRLRSYLVLLVAATMVPVIALAVVLIARGHQSNRAAVERGMRETVRAMAFTLDREIGIAFGRLDLLAAKTHEVFISVNIDLVGILDGTANQAVRTACANNNAWRC